MKERSAFFRLVIPGRAETRNLRFRLAVNLVLLLETAILATFLAGFAMGQNPSYQPSDKWHAPSRSAMQRNPLPASPDLKAGGRKLFEVHCAECHQANGSGLVEKHSADLRQPIVQAQSDGALFWKISNGNLGAGMPSFTRLPEKQRWQLVLFLRTLRAHAEEPATE